MEGNDEELAEFLAQQEGNDRHKLPASCPSQEQYGVLWPSEVLAVQTSYSSQGWVYQYGQQNLPLQDYGSQGIHGFSDAQASFIDLDPFSQHLDCVDFRPVETYIKPAETGPLLPGYGFNGYAGFCMEDKASPTLKSDQDSQLDSAYCSSEYLTGPPKFKQEATLDNQSEFSAVSGAQVSPSAPRLQAERTFGENQSTVSGSGKRKRASQPLPPCPHCKKFRPKNQSDSIKHERKHTKPFKCKFPECAAKGVGFSTENDRDRHYKSGRHNMAPEKGAKKGYICIACPPAAGSEPKWWPRQDNFKAHCSRKHPNWGLLDDLIRRSERDTKPVAAYVDDNTTLLSDAAYQQQSFAVQQDINSGYDVSQMAAFGQGQENQAISFDPDHFLMGMELSVQPIASPDTQTWPTENGFSLPTGAVKMETKQEESHAADSPLEKIPTTFLQRHHDYQAHMDSPNGLRLQQPNSQITQMQGHLSFPQRQHSKNARPQAPRRQTVTGRPSFNHEKSQETPQGQFDPFDPQAGKS